MKAIVYTEYGGPEVLKMEERVPLLPTENEIQIKVMATSVTPGDVANRRGESFLAKLFTGIRSPRNSILGYEYSGVVSALGEDVTNFQLGDTVFGTTGRKGGANAEYVCIQEDGLIAHTPRGLDHDEAAALPIGCMSALYFLRKAGVQNNHEILIYGASGSIGTYAIQLSKHFGARVTCVCSKSNLELVRSLGADEVIDYTSQDFRELERKYDFIFDAVGKITYKSCTSALKDSGLYLSVYMPLSHTFFKRVIGGIVDQNPEDVAAIKDLVESGTIRPVIDKVFDMEQISEAHEYVEQGHKKGNVLVKIAKT